MSSNNELKENDDVVIKYLDKNVVVIRNGKILNGIKEWILFHNETIKIAKTVECDIDITSFCGLSFAISYVFNIILINNKSNIIRGNSNIVMTTNKKISYIVETAYNKNIIAFNKNLQSLSFDKKWLYITYMTVCCKTTIIVQTTKRLLFVQIYKINFVL